MSGPQTSWKYTDVPQTNSDWTTQSYNDDQWNTATSESFPEFTSTTRYYRFTGSIENIDDIHSIYASLNTKNGFIYYLQGTEVYRYNVDGKPITHIINPIPESDGTYPVTVSANRFLLPEQGTFVIAFEVHLSTVTYSETFGADPFLCYIVLDKTNGINDVALSKFFNGNPSSVPTGYASNTQADMAFDEHSSTIYCTKASGSPIITYQFNNGRAEWLNYYSIQPYSKSHSYPKDWTVYGSNDGENWDVLDVQSNNKFVMHQQFIYFSLQNNTKSYNIYKLEVSSCTESTNCEINAWNGFSGTVIPPTMLSYPESSYTLIKNVDYIDITPECDVEDVTYSVSPALPGGLYLNSTTGSITGVIGVNPRTTQYIITVSNSAGRHSILLEFFTIIVYCEAENGWPKTEYTHTAVMACDTYEYEGQKTRYCDYADGHTVWQNVTDTCSLITCTYPELKVLVTRRFTINAYQEGFTIYKGTSTAGEYIVGYRGNDADTLTTKYFIVCLEQGQTYLIDLYDENALGWHEGSNLLLTFRDMKIYRCRTTQASLHNYDLFTVNFDFLSIPQTSWKYIDVPQTNNDWTTQSYNDDQWNTATAGSFPEFTSTTRYYRFTGYVENRDIIPTIYSSITNRYGFVYYLQGTEVYRYHMTNGTITSSTYATESDGTYPVTVSANRFLLPEQGTFVIAYEVHLNETQLDSTDPFLCYIALDKSNGVNNRTYTKFFNGYPSATPEGSHYETKSGMLFDDQIMGFYNTRASGSPVLSFRFKNGRSEWLNYYALGAESPEHSYPTSWTVYGSNDEETWDALDTQTRNVFVSTFTFNYFPFRNNTKSYRSYRMDVHSCRHSSICLVSEWYGFSGNVIPPTIFYYPEPSYTLVKNIDYIDITPVCDAADAIYSIYPALPGGLHLNTTTGSITGTITSTPSTTQYIVTATNSAGYRRIALYINVIILYCNADGKWPKTEYTRTVRMTCGSYDYEGLKSRYCDYADGRAVWQDVVDGCVLKLR